MIISSCWVQREKFKFFYNNNIIIVAVILIIRNFTITMHFISAS